MLQIVNGNKLGILDSELKNSVPNGDSTERSAAIEALISKFVEVGFFTINGNYNFYITSIYALEYFIKQFREWMPLLGEVFYKLFGGGKSELFTLIKKNPYVMAHLWEHIFALILGHLKEKTELEFPMDLSETYGTIDLPQIPAPDSWELLTFTGELTPDILQGTSENIYYMTPKATAIDGFILSGQTLLLTQIKYARDPSYLKKGLNKVVSAAGKWSKKGYNAIPWLIDVRDSISQKSLEGKNLLFTTMENLFQLLPDTLTEN